jgi:AraC-like DNA-binding protein/DNA gyrase inhibitor GyrI
MIASEHSTTQVAADYIDRRIRHAMRILENEQTPLPETSEVAARVGLSLFYFVRLFGEQVGLTPQDYGRSLVMMHAAGRIRYSRDPIGVVARDFGYAKQATFNKAFTRHHGLAPARWRRKAQAEIVPVSGEGVRLVDHPARRCLARRYLGPRHLTWGQWMDFVGRLPADLHDRPRLGFTYDDPRVTPPARIRHDCAVEVADDAVLPEELAEDGFELLESPAGLWAMTDVAPGEVADGYRAIFDGWFQGRPDYAMEGDPFLERYGRTPGRDLVVTVCVRVRRLVEEGDFNMAVLPPDAPTEPAA